MGSVPLKPVLLASLVALASCAAEHGRVELRVAHALLSPGSTSDGTLVVEVEGRSVTRLPAGLGRPLASNSTLITGPSNEPLAASPSAGERVLLVESYSGLPLAGESHDFGRVEPLPGQRVLVPAGCVAALSIAPASRVSDDPPLVGLLIHSGPAGTRPVLTVRAERDTSEEEEALDAPALPPESRAVSTRVDWPLEQTEGSFVLAVLPAPDRGIAAPTLWRLTVRETGPDEPAAEEARLLADTIRASAAPPAGATRWPSMALSLRQAEGPVATRAALAFAAVGTAADATAEVAALAEDDLVRVLAVDVAEVLEGAAAETGANSMGWTLDRATILALARLHADSALPRVLSSMLSARYGEVGRDPPALAELARRSASAAEMDRRLEAEHLMLLDDASPALRVRAYDWLSSRGLAPARYDPFGPVRDRRAAVDRHLQEAEGRQAEDKP